MPGGDHELRPDVLVHTHGGGPPRGSDLDLLTGGDPCLTASCRLAGYGDGAEIGEELVEWDYGRYGGRTTPAVLRWNEDCHLGPDQDALLAPVGSREEM